MTRRHVIGLVMLLGGSALPGGACAHPNAPVVPIPSNAAEAIRRLSAADDLVRVGCFDCLIEAHGEYDAVNHLSAIPIALADRGATGSIRALVLLAIRERELGMADDGYLEQAEQAAGFREDVRAVFQPLIDVVKTLPGETPATVTVSPADRQRIVTERRFAADADPLSAYEWIAAACAFDRTAHTAQALLPPLMALRVAPIVTYRVALCVGDDVAPLLAEEPRFKESNAAIAQRLLSQLRIDEAEQSFMDAYAWHPRWPLVTRSLGTLYFAFEEFDTSLDFYDQTLTFIPDDPTALLGRVKALSYLARHAEAFDTIDRMLDGPTRIEPGDAYYWRAWNDLELDRVDDAWTAIEDAGRLWKGFDVVKLSGIIAFRRSDLDVARQRFDAALKLNPGDCEAMYYSAQVYLEQKNWTAGADAFIGASACYEHAQRALKAEITDLRSSSMAEDRKARQIAGHEQQIADAVRMEATSFFNTAVAFANASRFEEARAYAARVVGDDQFGDRVRDLLARIDASVKK